MTATSMNDGRVVLHKADCRDVLRGMPDNSIDSVVTDPPYALVSIVKRFGKPGSAPAKGNDAYMRASAGFMGKSWDTGEVAFSDEFWAEVLRVLKPGGHVVAFSGTRTYHRMAVAIEDAGFECRDMLSWIYGSGFPKSHNQHGDWEGWGTALKPAHEPICLARKPLMGTVTANLAEHGCGAINVDGCRIEYDMSDTNPATNPLHRKMAGYANGNASDKNSSSFSLKDGSGERNPNQLGRWPANVIHDGSDEVVAAFPDTKSGSRKAGEYGLMGYHGADAAPMPAVYGDSGSASRFFYCAKASRKDRDEGLGGFPLKPSLKFDPTSAMANDGKRGSGVAKNIHPTVKPTTLMQWLCRLVTPPGGVILDPFMGSGSTGKGAVLEGFQFVGIEREEEYMQIAKARIAWAVQPANDNVPVQSALWAAA